jgi:capsular polysaccharide transport system permease protein
MNALNPLAEGRPVEVLRRPAGPARARLRHRLLVLFFALAVLLPTAVTALYLYTRAADQYASTVAFAVRSEETTTAMGLLSGLSGLTSLSGSTGADSNILNEYVQSQELVQKIDARMNLRGLYARPQGDPVFALSPSGSVEQLTDYWRRVVHVSHDHSTGLIELRVNAFAPGDAQAIAAAILDEAQRKINELSAIARADATRYAREDLDQAAARLAKARVALTEFRARNHIVDPAADVQGQMGLLASLQSQQAAAMIEYNLLQETARPGDPRLSQARRRLDVVEQMIADERAKLGDDPAGGRPGYSALVGEYERLAVEREFAERAYLATLTAYDNARAEAQRKSRYLAAYVLPTLPETPLYPRRFTLSALVFGFSLLVWSVAVLIWYSVRDRR